VEPSARVERGARQERVTAIEFRWVGRAGVQPVVLVAREWLN
jgi:hypothetical protein